MHDKFELTADEFLYSAQEQNLKLILKNYEEYPEGDMHWIIYGSNCQE